MNDLKLKQWAAKWGVSAEALAELPFFPPERAPAEGTKQDPASEAGVQARLLLEAPARGVRLWRNNVGAGFMIDMEYLKKQRRDLYNELIKIGNFVRFGLANESKNMNEIIKSSDLIGIRPVKITKEHLGRRLGVFVARDVKPANWTYKDTAHEKAQLNFLTFVARMGGDAAFANGPGSL